MELSCWPAAQGLASFDVDSLTALAYARFLDAKANVHHYRVPRFSIKFPALPALNAHLRQVGGDEASKPNAEPASDDQSGVQRTNVQISGLGRVLSFLNEAKPSDASAEAGFIEQELSLLTLIENQLKPAVLYVLWFDTAVYDSITYPYYASCAGFPTGYALAAKLQEAARDRIVSATKWQSSQHTVCTSGASLRKNEVAESVVNSVMQIARDCLVLLNERLAKRPFLLAAERDDDGSSKSASIDRAVVSKADALLFACCAILRRANANCSVAQTSSTGAFLTAFRNSTHLAAFVDRVQSGCFSELRSAESERKDALKKSEFTSGMWRKATLVFVGGCVALACYALSTGLVQVAIDNESEEESESAKK